MQSSLVYEKATAKDHSLLTDIVYLSKKHWKYTDEQMNLWKDELTIDEGYIQLHPVYKVFYNKVLIGFYALKYDNEEDCYEIEHLWFTPENINKGFGRQVFRKIIEQLSFLKQHRCILTAEPNAKGFYKKMNGNIIKTFESKIPGRMLDVYEFKIM